MVRALQNSWFGGDTGQSTHEARSRIEANGTAIGLGQIFYGSSLETMFNAPGLPPNGDSRARLTLLWSRTSE